MGGTLPTQESPNRSPSQYRPLRGRCRRQRGRPPRIATIRAVGSLPLSRCATAPPVEHIECSTESPHPNAPAPAAPPFPRSRIPSPPAPDPRSAALDPPLRFPSPPAPRGEMSRSDRRGPSPARGWRRKPPSACGISPRKAGGRGDPGHLPSQSRSALPRAASIPSPPAPRGEMSRRDRRGLPFPTLRDRPPLPAASPPAKPGGEGSRASSLAKQIRSPPVQRQSPLPPRRAGGDAAGRGGPPSPPPSPQPPRRPKDRLPRIRDQHA